MRFVSTACLLQVSSSLTMLITFLKESSIELICLSVIVDGKKPFKPSNAHIICREASKMTEIELQQRHAVRSEETKTEANEALLSKAELEFLRGTKSVSSNYERVLFHRIFKKLVCFRDEILPVLARNQKTLPWVESITENCNRITNFSNTTRNDEMLQNSLFLQNSTKLKWTGGDLNPRPPECKSGVHTN